MHTSSPSEVPRSILNPKQEHEVNLPLIQLISPLVDVHLWLSFTIPMKRGGEKTSNSPLSNTHTQVAAVIHKKSTICTFSYSTWSWISPGRLVGLTEVDPDSVYLKNII